MRRLGLALALALAGAPASDATARTVVSLEFDFTSADQYKAAKLIERFGMRATFFVNSALIGKPGRMTYPQLRELQARGHEVAGNTRTHARLPELPLRMARHEICADRVALLDHGLAADAFAYPFGSYTQRLGRVVRDCGYSSARIASGVVSRGKVCINCPYAETIPPRDRFATRMPSAIQGSKISPALDTVRAAEAAGGGWIQLLMHRVCRRCNRYAITLRSLRLLLRWLLKREDVEVLTVSQVLDRAGPWVRVVPPAHVPAAASRVTFGVRFSAPRGVRKVRYFIDHRLVRARHYDPWRLKHMLSWRMRPGAHTLTAMLEDAAGNVALSPPVRFLTGPPEPAR